MQHKGIVKFFAVVFILVCLFQLSFTLVSYIYSVKGDKVANSPEVKKLANSMAMGNPLKEEYLYDSISKSRLEKFNKTASTATVYNLFIQSYNLKDVREREINLGLDLKGGMNVTMEVSVPDVIRALSGNNTDPAFTKALQLAIEKQKSSTKDFVTLFYESFKQTAPNARLSSFFNSEGLKNIKDEDSDEKVKGEIDKECKDAIERTFKILRTRIDRFGVVQPNIQKLANGRILIELPGIKDPERVRKLLQGTAQLEFWTTYQYAALQPFFVKANSSLAVLLKMSTDSTRTDSAFRADTAAASKSVAAKVTLPAKNEITKNEPAKGKTDSADIKLLKQSGKDAKTSAAKKLREPDAKGPLFSKLISLGQNNNGQDVYGQGAMVGRASVNDTSEINHLIQLTKERLTSLYPGDLKLAWTAKPTSLDKGSDKAKGSAGDTIMELVALKVTLSDGSPALGGDVITDARQDYSQSGQIEVTMSMNDDGARAWERITGDNIGKQVAIVLDGFVYSYPNVNVKIPNGSSVISGGNMDLEEALDLANILKAGKLPAPAHIVAEEIVGPSLGQESINAGMLSFIIAFIGVLLYMSLYYKGAGHVADIALFANVFFLFGVLASIGAVLTLPGIAGIVLTLAMAVDSNVIIYERMREEIRVGKGMRLVVKDGFHHALSAIVDGHVTTILTGIVLYIFGSGPVQGFATTLVIGLLLSLFSSIFIARLVFEFMLDRNMKITTGNKYTMNLFQHMNIDFIGLRKKMYILSIAIIIPGMISIFVRGLDPGLDFTGGRSYIVRFDQNVSTTDVRESLNKSFGESPEVKTFGPSNQVKITTKFMIKPPAGKTNSYVDSIVDIKLFEGVQQFYKTKLTYTDFKTNTVGKLVGELSSQRVDPAISYSLIWKAVMAVFFSLIIIFVYIAIRFKNWQFGIGGVVSLFHDSLIIITMFTLFHGILPFGMEIDQSFIAAILTIIGYSIMDTVIIFDRIREYRSLYPKRELSNNINGAINHTLGRTINTSGVTLVVLITIFIFGGEVLRGFTFALIIGVISGTYSSVFNATPIAYDIILWQKRRKELKNAETKVKSR